MMGKGLSFWKFNSTLASITEYCGIGKNIDWTDFGPFFGPFYEGRSTLSVLREGGMQSISTEGGVGGRVLLLREG